MQAYIPDRIEQLITELQDKKVDKSVLTSEIHHLKQVLEDNKEYNSREFKRLFKKLDDLEEEIGYDSESFKKELDKDRDDIIKRVDKNSDSITNIYKWFAGIMITIFLSYGGTALFFVKAASDISEQVIINSQRVEIIKQDIDNLIKKDQEIAKKGLPKPSSL